MNKLKNSKGFTLLEMTVSLMTVTIVTSMLFLMVNLVRKVYINMEEVAESQVLCSTLTNAIQDELRFASIIQIDPNDCVNGKYAFTYFSESLGIGADSSFANVDHDGRSMIAVQQDGVYYYFVSEKSYIHNLEAFVDARYDPTEGKQAFYVTIKVLDYISGKIEDPLIESTFQVAPLNIR